MTCLILQLSGIISIFEVLKGCMSYCITIIYRTVGSSCVTQIVRRFLKLLGIITYRPLYIVSASALYILVSTSCHILKSRIEEILTPFNIVVWQKLCTTSRTRSICLVTWSTTTYSQSVDSGVVLTETSQCNTYQHTCTLYTALSHYNSR